MGTFYVDPLTGASISKEEYERLSASGRATMDGMAEKARIEADRRRNLIAQVATKLELSAEDAALLFR